MGGSKKGGAPQAAANPAATAEAKMAQQYYNQTDPIRQQLLSQYNSFASNPTANNLPGYQQQYGLGRAGLEGQYGQARNQIMESSPQGGVLQNALANLSGQRASGVGTLGSQIYSQLAGDVQNKGYGAAFGAPSTALSGLGSAAGTQQSGINANLASQQAYNQQQNSMMSGLGSGLCCFIFIAANGGILHPIVRQYRDEHMTAKNRRGYYRISERLVPLMKKIPLVRKTVQKTMTEPMTCYGAWFYGLNRFGWIFLPVAKFWLSIFNLLGFGKFTRKNGEVI